MDTDLAMAIPFGYYGRLASRSSLALKNMIEVGAGVIDADYRGAVGVVLFNYGPEDFHVKRGDRIAQLILEQAAVPEIRYVDELDDAYRETGGTYRGVGGFGSTGTN